MNATVSSASSSSSVLPPAGSVKKEEDEDTATATISMLGLKKEEEKEVKKEEDEDDRDHAFRTRCFDQNSTMKKKKNIPSTMVPDQVSSCSSSNNSSRNIETENHNIFLGDGDDDDVNHRRFEKWKSGNWCWLDDNNNNNDVMKKEEEKVDNGNGVKNEEEEDNDNGLDTNSNRNDVDNNGIKKEEEIVDNASSVNINITNKNKNNGNRLEEATVPDDNIESTTNDPNDWTTGNWCWEVGSNLTNIGRRAASASTSVAVLTGTTNRMEEATIPDAKIKSNDTNDQNDWTTGNWCWEERPNPTNVGGRMKKRKLEQSSDNDTKKPRSINIIQNNTNNSITMNSNDDSNSDRLLDGDDDDDTADDEYDSNVDYNKEQWKMMYGQLLKYKKKYKSTSVPTRTFDDNRSLGQWVVKQRCCYKNNKLSQDRINLLNSINFDWNPFDTQWTEIYERLLAYKNKYKSTSVPTTFEVDGRRLGRWVDNQRRLYNINKLSEDRINQLNSIGFVWSSRDTKWTEMYEKLLAYKNQYESTCVQKSYKADTQLREWVRYQRKSFNNGNPNLTVYKINILNSIGFVWNVLDT